MYLTREEERILEGEKGEAMKTAMELIVRVGEALGAEKLVPVKHAHISGISYDNVGDAGLEFIEDFARKGARFTVYTTFNPVGIVLGRDPGGINSRERVKKQARIIKALLKMGAEYTATCVPYLLRPPALGEHLAWGESSAVAVANSIYGARTNREGGPIALAAAIIGKTYYWGLHIDENRKPTVKVIVEKDAIRGEASAGALGYIIANYDPNAIPIIYGFPRSRRLAIALCSAAAAQGSIALCFIEGISPEFKKAQKHEVEDHIRITRKDVEKAMDEISCAENDADHLFVGCPHYSLEEAASLAARAKSWKHIWVAVPAVDWFKAKDLAKKVSLLPGTCIVVTDKSRLPKPISTNSVKTALYLCKAGIPVKLVEV